MADKVRIGIIGVGQIGKSHLRKYKEIPEANVVAAADLREDELGRVAQEFGIPHTYSDYHALLQRDDLDAVDVCLHNRFHRPVTVDVLRAGKHAYCEKPMSWTYQDALAMQQAARDTGNKLHIQLATLYAAETRGAQRLIQEGHLGDLYYAKSLHYRRRGRPFVDGYGTSAFVNTGTSGGGAMLDMAVYHISRMLFLLGNPELISVSGSTFQKLDNMYPDRRQSSGYDVEELGTGLARLAGGVTFMLEEAWAIHSDDPDADYVYGAKGGVRVSPLTYFTTLGDMEMNGTFDTKKAEWRWNQCDPTAIYYTESQRHWVGALLGRVPLLDTAGIALKTAFITEGIYVSSALGREVTAAEIAASAPGFGRV
jgi:predicted dehydrogenase